MLPLDYVLADEGKVRAHKTRLPNATPTGKLLSEELRKPTVSE